MGELSEAFERIGLSALIAQQSEMAERAKQIQDSLLAKELRKTTLHQEQLVSRMYEEMQRPLQMLENEQRKLLQPIEQFEAQMNNIATQINSMIAQITVDFKEFGPVMIEAAKRDYKRRKISYKGLIKRFGHYFASKGLVLPESFKEFLQWFTEKHFENSAFVALINDFSEHDIQDYCEWLTQVHERVRTELTKDEESQILESAKGESEILKNHLAKPKFKPESITTIFDLLKDFFSQEQQKNLQTLLETGNDVPERLTFLDSGNRLADAFKQLIDGDIITACMKTELEGWISRNFRFRYRGEILAFKEKYLNDIISSKGEKCKKPILNVVKEKSTGQTLIKKA